MLGSCEGKEVKLLYGTSYLVKCPSGTLRSLASKSLKPIFENEKGETLTATRTVFGLATQIVRFEIAANRWQLEWRRTANRDSRHLRSLAAVVQMGV